MSKHKGITEDDRQKISELYEAGSTQVELASLFGVSQRSISYHLKKAGVDTRQGREANPFKGDPGEAKRLYESGMSQAEVASELGVAQAQVWKYLDHLGVETRAHSELTYAHNKEFFDEPNVVNSYWAGFIAADGSVTPRDEDANRSAQMRIGIHPDDVELLEALKEASESENPIERRPNSSGREYVYFRVSSDEWTQALDRNFNITPNKAKVLVPPRHLDGACAWAFARGYFDGDGHATKCGTKLNICSGSRDFMEWMIRELFGAHHKIYENNGSWSCYVSGEVFRRVSKKLYEGSTPNTRLNRKYIRLALHWDF